MSTHKNQMNYFRIALQSALAAALCLGLPAGLLLWLILMSRAGYAFVDPLIAALQVNGLRSIFVLVMSSVLWSYLLARISGYHPWWRLAVATACGILAAWFSPLANLDGILYEALPDLPVHLNYRAAMIGILGGVTLFVGFGYGLVLKNIKAAFTLGLTTSLMFVFVLLLTISLFESLGLRVGAGNLAMPKVTALGLLLSALSGGAMLGVGFSRLGVEAKRGSSSIA